jgi:hypothetical protein
MVRFHGLNNGRDEDAVVDPEKEEPTETLELQVMCPTHIRSVHPSFPFTTGVDCFQNRSDFSPAHCNGRKHG